MQDGRGDSLAGIPTEEKSRRTRWCAPSATWRDLRRASAANRDLQCSGERKSAEKSPARPGISPVKRLRLESPPTSADRELGWCCAYHAGIVSHLLRCRNRTLRLCPLRSRAALFAAPRAD